MACRWSTWAWRCRCRGDAKRGQAALAAAFAKSSSERPSYFGDYGSAIRDDALMIALTHENKLAKPAWDARAVDLGRGLDARRNAGWMWLSTQEQVAIARLGRRSPPTRRRW